MNVLFDENTIDWAEESSRSAFTKSLAIVASINPDVIMMVADLGRAMRAHFFYEIFPDRFVQCGIAENNMIGMAGGLASCGKIPFAATFAPFAALRACEFIRDAAAYPELNVKIVGTDGGPVMGTLGPTHYGIEDMGVMRAIPQVTVLSPSDGPDILEAVRAAAETDGAFYIRLTGKSAKQIYARSGKTDIKKAVEITDGDDATIIATGAAVGHALGAAEILKKEGVSAGVVNIRCIKPVDAAAIAVAARKTGRVITVEEHTVVGGLGSAVAEAMAESGAGRLLRLGMPDRFDATVAPYADMLERYGLTPGLIAKSVREFLKKQN